MFRRGCYGSLLSLCFAAPVLFTGCGSSKSPDELAAATPPVTPAASPTPAAPATNANNSAPQSSSGPAGGSPSSGSPSSGSQPNYGSGSGGSGSGGQDNREQQQLQQQQEQMARQAEMQKQMEEQQRIQQQQQEENQRAMQQQQLQLEQQMQQQQQSGYGSQSGAPVEELPKTLRGRAERAYSLGHEKIAYRLLQAAALASPTEASTIIPAVRWATPRNQPQLGLRLAVGVDYKGPYGLADLKPIGSTQANGGQNAQAGYNSSNSSSSDSSSSGGPGGAEKSRPSIERFAGTMATLLIKHMRDMHKEGKLSEAFKGVAIKVQETTTNNSSEYGSSGPQSSGGAPGGPAISPKGDADEGNITTAAPGLSYIGIESTANLVKTAKKEGFDGLVVFEVAVSVNRRNGTVNNECKAKLVNLSDGKPIIGSKVLKNTEVQKELAKSDGDGGVEKVMQPILDKLDEKFSLNDLPSVITAEVIKSKRLGTLISDRSKLKLDALMEVKLYQEKGFLTDGEVEVAFDAILGSDVAAKLVSGSEEEKAAAAEKLIGK